MPGRFVAEEGGGGDSGGDQEAITLPPRSQAFVVLLATQAKACIEGAEEQSVCVHALHSVPFV